MIGINPTVITTKEMANAIAPIHRRYAIANPLISPATAITGLTKDKIATAIIGRASGWWIRVAQSQNADRPKRTKGPRTIKSHTKAVMTTELNSSKSAKNGAAARERLPL
jgi:hypothetical protein